MATALSATPTDGVRFVPSPLDQKVFPKTLTTQERLEMTNALQGSLLPKLNELAASAHHIAFSAVLDSTISETALRDTKGLLAELADRGFAWSDIARLLRVSVPALRKWRTGEAEPTGPNRRSIARLVAFISILEDQCGVENACAWFETPFIDSYMITPIDLYVEECYEAIHDVAGGRLTAATALDRYIPGWRQSGASRVEVFTAADGGVAIRPKSI